MIKSRNFTTLTRRSNAVKKKKPRKDEASSAQVKRGKKRTRGEDGAEWGISREDEIGSTGENLKVAERANVVIITIIMKFGKQESGVSLKQRTFVITT